MLRIKQASLLFSAWLLACSLALAAQPGKTYHFTVLHTNDMHARFWADSDGQLGLAAQKTLINAIRAEVRAQGGSTLVLNAGDVNTGVPESDMQDAEPMFVGMNQIRYDAMAIGNHEFDRSLSLLQKQRGWAHFPLLSANIRDRQGKQMFAASKRFDLGGLKVAVLGLITPDTAKMTNPQIVAGVQFTDPQLEAAKLVPALRRKSDVVIALTHLGYYADGLHGSLAAGDVELARAVPGLDLIVGGHSHTVLCMAAPNVLESSHVPGSACQPDRQDGSWIVQAGEWGKYVGRADFEYRQGKLSLQRYTLIPVNLKHEQPGTNGASVKQLYGPAIAQDALLLSTLQVFQQRGQLALSRVIGRLDQPLDGDRSRVRRMPTNLGAFAGQAFMARTHADLALLNSGGIRDSLPAGDVSYRDVLKVFPFGSNVVTIDLSGAELIKLLSAALHMSPGSGGYPQFAGVSLVLKNGQLDSALIAGQVVDPVRSYRLVTNDFVAAGGDGYPKLNSLPGYADSGVVDAEVLKDYLVSQHPVVH
jgi:5'-nucleotidase/UDP-sugar diphosphatase